MLSLEKRELVEIQAGVEINLIEFN